MLAAKPKPCDGGCEAIRPIWKNFQGKAYCQGCWRAHQCRTQPSLAAAPCWPNSTGSFKPKSTDLATKPAPRKALRHVSPKHAAELREYSALRLAFLKLPEHSCCEAQLTETTCQGCNPDAREIHHSRGRGGFLLDTSTWIVLCEPCHKWLEVRPNQSRELGFTKSRLHTND